MKRIVLYTGIIFFASTGISQNLVPSFQGKSKPYKEVKNSEIIGLNADGNSYFFTTWFEQANTQYYLECFNSKGEVTAEKKLEINLGVFNNSFSIDQVISLGGKVYALVEHLDKPAGKKTLLARIIEPSGLISTEELELLSFPFEKTMNSGFNQVITSPDQRTLLAVGELPFVKDQSAKVKLSLFDNVFNKKHELEITIPGEDTKNKTLSAYVANDGTVYLVKRTTTKNGEISLHIIQIDPITAELKEYPLQLAAPQQFYNYTCDVNNENELVICGTIYERKSVQVGEKTATSIFYFVNENKTQSVSKTFLLNSPVENLCSRKILFEGNTIFFTAEQFKEEKITPTAAASTASFDYNYTYTHKNEYIFGIGTDGSKKFELNLSKDFTASNFDKQYWSTYFLANGKFNIIYNDLSKKYSDYYEQNITPVLVQINSDGLMGSPILFQNNLKVPYNMTLYPVYFVQNSKDQFSFLLKNMEHSQLMHLRID